MLSKYSYFAIVAYAALGIGYFKYLEIYQPFESEKLAVIYGMAVFFVVGWAIAFTIIYGRNRNLKKLLETGIKGKVRMVNVEQTNTQVDGNFVLKMKVEVRIPGRDFYTVVIYPVVPHLYLSSVQKNSVLPVSINQKDPKIMAFDWDRM